MMHKEEKPATTNVIACLDLVKRSSFSGSLILIGLPNDLS